MDFNEVVRKRRMVRRFKPDPIPRETIEDIIETAQHSPSAGFSQGVSFVVVTDPEVRKQVARIAVEDQFGPAPFMWEAPVQIIVCASEKVYRDRYSEPDKRPDPNGPEFVWPVPYWHTDAGMTLMLIFLAAVNEGLDAGYMGCWDNTGLQTYLGIPEHFTPIGVTMIGHRDTDTPSPSLKRGRRALGDVLHWQHW